MKKYRILSTRHLSTALSASLEKAGLELIEKDFIRFDHRISPENLSLLEALLNRKDLHIVFTSANAVISLEKSGIQMPQGAKVFCLSGKTRECIAHSFPDAAVIAEADNASGLAGKIIEAGIREVIFLCGNLRRDELPVTLREAGIEVREVLVYETVPEPAEVNVNPDAVLFFSPSAADAFFQKNTLNENIPCFAIGDTTASAIRLHTPNAVFTASRPSPEELVEQVREFFKKVNT